MLSGPHQKFCEGIVAGMKAFDAHAAAYPEAKGNAGRKYAYELLAKSEIEAEIARMRALAQEKAGESVMSVMEKRLFLARIVRAQVTLLPEDSDLWQSIKYTKYWTGYEMPNKLAAIVVDNDLASDGADALVDDSLAQLLTSLRMVDG